MGIPLSFKNMMSKKLEQISLTLHQLFHKEAPHVVKLKIEVPKTNNGKYQEDMNLRERLSNQTFKNLDQVKKLLETRYHSIDNLKVSVNDFGKVESLSFTGRDPFIFLTPDIQVTMHRDHDQFLWIQNIDFMYGRTKIKSIDLLDDNGWTKSSDVYCNDQKMNFDYAINPYSEIQKRWIHPEIASYRPALDGIPQTLVQFGKTHLEHKIKDQDFRIIDVKFGRRDDTDCVYVKSMKTLINELDFTIVANEEQGYTVQYPDPKNVNFDAIEKHDRSGKLHYESGPALIHEDGEFYALNGITISKEVFQKIKFQAEAVGIKISDLKIPEPDEKEGQGISDLTLHSSI
ncbi:MAG TPA: hypothetical protein VIY47_02585 [Ignavibacteriaceae bacterium]